MDRRHCEERSDEAIAVPHVTPIGLRQEGARVLAGEKPLSQMSGIEQIADSTTMLA